MLTDNVNNNNNSDDNKSDKVYICFVQLLSLIYNNHSNPVLYLAVNDVITYPGFSTFN